MMKMMTEVVEMKVSVINLVNVIVKHMQVNIKVLPKKVAKQVVNKVVMPVQLLVANKKL